MSTSRSASRAGMLPGADVIAAAASGPLSPTQVAALTQEPRQFRVVSGDAGWALSAP